MAIAAPVPTQVTIPSHLPKLQWTTISSEGDVLQVRTAPIPDYFRESMARALELGKAATNTTTPETAPARS